MCRVKICGITRAEDAQAAARAGADAIGLIFVPGSPRYLEHQKAREILGTLQPFVTPVGVFMDADIGHVRDTALQLRLRTVQLHGNEPFDSVRTLAPLAVLKGLAVRDESIYDDIRRWTAAGVAGILLDRPRTASESDRAGIRLDLLRADVMRHHCPGAAPLILAGGLSPANVAHAVRLVRPWAVDVSSGVERTPGVKDHNLIQDFVLNARRAAHLGAQSQGGPVPREGT